MADTLTPEQRSERMSRIRGKDTKPERVVRRVLTDLGYRYRLNVRRLPGAPDIAFIHKDHLPATEPEEAFWPGPPDLAVEVVSPGDTLGEVDEKVKAWLDASAAMVWVVNPHGRNVTVYRSSTDIKVLTENDDLDGQDVVPGFRCRVRDVFVD